MPPTRNCKAAKQKRFVQSRLMLISMVIDDYVYKGKPISVEEAAGYIDEIAGYKMKCIGDARSLQVIVKITRCMKSVINEQASNSNQMEVSQSTGDTNINESPVSSLPDVDIRNGTHNIPKTTQNIPKATQNTTKATHNTPKATHNIPKATQNTPKATQNIPKATQNIPKATQNTPKATQNIPKATQNIPKATQNIPNATQNITGGTQNITKATQNIPKAHDNPYEVIDENNFYNNLNIETPSRNNVPVMKQLVKDISVKSAKNTCNALNVMSGGHKKTETVINTVRKPNETTINKNIDKEVIEIIDLCGNNENFANNEKPIDVEMHRALSNLSLKETVPMSVDFECSQSILEDYTQDDPTCHPECHIGDEKIYNDEYEEIQVFKKPIVPDPSLKTQTDYPRKEVSVTNINNKANSNSDNKIEISDSKMEKPCNGKTKIDDIVVESNLKKMNLQKKTTKTNKSKSQKATATISEIPKKKINKKYTKPTNKRTKNSCKSKNEDSKIAMQDIRSFFAVQKNNESKSLAKIIEPVSEHRPTSTTVLNTVIVERPSIYTTNVLDDLSWMENIRFVKEIATDEYDSNLGGLEDTFWDNLTLPYLEDHDFTVY